jgi:transketolase
MAPISNGLALHGYAPYCSTFLAFADYCRPAIRLSAMMNLPVAYIFSHDGVANAQDGATHQGNETIASLRVIPNFNVYRPADNLETAACYEFVFEQQKPAGIILSRGDMPCPCGANTHNITKPKAILMASGSEVGLCVKAQKFLGGLGIFVNVISVPCLEKFDDAVGVIEKLIGHKPDLPAFVRYDVIPPRVVKPTRIEWDDVPVVAVEMGSGMPWWALFGRYGFRGAVVSFDDFGASGVESDVRFALGFTPEQIADKVLELLKDK